MYVSSANVRKRGSPKLLSLSKQASTTLTSAGTSEPLRQTLSGVFAAANKLRIPVSLGRHIDNQLPCIFIHTSHAL